MSVLQISTCRPSGPRRLRTVIAWGIIVVIMMGSLEVACRLFWMTQGAGFWGAHRNLHLNSYHELLSSRVLSEQRCKDCFDILFLGGSALTRNYGSIQDILAEELSRRSTRRIRIYNLAMEGHFSLDSYYKYRHLEHRHFDLVMVYEAINETRANDFPAAIIRSFRGTRW